MTRLVIVGGGQMGEALLAGALSSTPQPHVSILEPADERARDLADRYGVAVSAGPEEAQASLREADIVVLAVKPRDIVDVAAACGPQLGPQSLVVSIAAGVTCATVEAALPPATPVVRAMPNTPALIGKGVSAVSAGSRASENHVTLACDVLAGVGDVVVVAEHQLDAVTAVSGSGPAYVYLAIEALIDAGVAEGLPRDLARRLVVGTVAGSAAMVAETGQHPAALRDAVTSPAGTTGAAVAALEERAVRGALREAVTAAARRSRELSKPPRADAS